MPRVDQAQAVGGAREGVEQAVGLHAGQAEHGVDAVAQQAVNDRFSAGHAWHGVILVLRCRARRSHGGAAAESQAPPLALRLPPSLAGRTLWRRTTATAPPRRRSGRDQGARHAGTDDADGRAGWGQPATIERTAGRAIEASICAVCLRAPPDGGCAGHWVAARGRGRLFQPAARTHAGGGSRYRASWPWPGWPQAGAGQVECRAPTMTTG